MTKPCLTTRDRIWYHPLHAYNEIQIDIRTRRASTCLYCMARRSLGDGGRVEICLALERLLARCWHGRCLWLAASTGWRGDASCELTLRGSAASSSLVLSTILLASIAPIQYAYGVALTPAVSLRSCTAISTCASAREARTKSVTCSDVSTAWPQEDRQLYACQNAWRGNIR